MNLGRLSLDNIEKFGEFTSLHYEGASYTNVELDNYARRMATVLKAHGVKTGDHVVVKMVNSPHVTTAFQALWKLGAVVIPVTPQLTAREVRYLIEDSDAQVVLTSPELADRLREATEGIEGFRHLLVVGETDVARAENVAAQIEAAGATDTFVECDGDDMAILLYTSGTTGKPKGVMLTHHNLLSNHRTVAALRNVEPQSTFLQVLPLSHSFGVLTMDMAYIHGVTMILLPKFDAVQSLEAIDRFKIERLSLVPTMLTYLINAFDPEKYDVSSLTRVNSGGASLPNEVRLEFERLFGCTVVEGYGLSESSPTATSYADDEDYRPGSVGHAIEGVQLRIVDEQGNRLPSPEQGEICIKGPNVMKGYWKNEEATRAALKEGWLHSGDIGYLDADGYLFITDRKKDLIIKGGENISPREIEEAIHEHPAVAEVAVVGAPDPLFVETICAVVALKPGARATEDEIKQHTAKYVTKFKVPSSVLFIPELPKNPTGKIMKREIRDQLPRLAVSGQPSAISD